MLWEREGGREGERERGGTGEREYAILNTYKPNLYLPISFYFCKKDFLRDFTTF